MNSVVVLNKEDYIEKIQSQLSDTLKYKKLRKVPTDEIKKKLINLYK